jgi:thiol-disulfide isomerase/thioredoxin
MNRFLTFVFVCFLLNNLTAQDSGMVFFQGNWTSLLDKARAENKLVFIDAYTTWCGPCKRMSSDVFTSTEVGEFYNRNFINYKLDMERGEGPKISQQYGVAAYPTYLFVNGTGELVHRGLGFLPREDFIDLGKKAVGADVEKANPENPREKSQAYTPDMLYKDAFDRLAKRDGSHIVTARNYLNMQADWLSETNRKFIYNMATEPYADLFTFMLRNRPAFEEMFGADAVNSKYNNLMNTLLAKTTLLSEQHELDTIIKLYYPAATAPRLMMKHSMTWHRQRGDKAAFGEAATAYFKKYSDNPEEMVEAVWTVHDNIQNQTTRQNAVRWAKKAVKLEKSYYTYEAYAHILAINNKDKQAVKFAQKAVDIAQANDQEHSNVDGLLNRLKNK